MNLAVDIGNTRIKAGLFEGSTLKEQRWLPDQAALRRLAEDRSIEAVIVSSVTESAEELRRTIRATVPYIILDNSTPLPFSNTYATLGVDRIAALAGAQNYYPQKSVLVIDAGSCITYDIMDQQACYQGGVISPGIHMRLRAMHTFTARLPLVELENNHTSLNLNLTARNTPDSLRSGAIQGTVAEISQMIRMYTDKFSDLCVIVCGGDVAYLSHLDQNPSVTFVPELTLIGLNRILQYNVNPKN